MIPVSAFRSIGGVVVGRIFWSNLLVNCPLTLVFPSKATATWLRPVMQVLAIPQEARSGKRSSWGLFSFGNFGVIWLWVKKNTLGDYSF